MKCFLVDKDDPEFKEKIQKPGAMWYCPWYYDPTKDEPISPSDTAKHMLSIYYIRDNSRSRSPISVRCPNGSVWCVDQKSTNGNGWNVTGSAPNITCNPSINISYSFADRQAHPGMPKDYHGYLRNGEFTPDLSGNTYE